MKNDVKYILKYYNLIPHISLCGGDKILNIYGHPYSAILYRDFRTCKWQPNYVDYTLLSTLEEIFAV